MAHRGVNKSRKGLDFERKIKGVLERNGWVAFRSAASKGPADVVAFKPGRTPIFVQCKYHGRMDYDEWNPFYELCERIGVTPVLAWQQKFPNIPVFGLLTGTKTGLKGYSPPLEEYIIDDDDAEAGSDEAE